MPTITIEEFLNINDRKNNYLKLKRLTSSVGLDNIIDSSYYNRPGMALFRYFIDFAYDKIQVFGRGEANYVITLDKENKIDGDLVVVSFELIFNDGSNDKDKVKLIKRDDGYKITF